MTVVVTGAAGFLGRHLVAALAARGERVVGIDRRPGIPAAAAIAVTADLADPQTDAVEDLLRAADSVFHLAAFPGVREKGDHAARRRRLDNVETARRVVESVPLDVPVIVTSSSSVYGGSTGAPCEETDTPRPRGGYANSKLDVERLCAKRVSRGGLVAVARPFTVAGEGQRPDMAIARWLTAARAGLPLPVYGSVNRTRDITDVADVVEGLLRMRDRGVRSTVNLGTGVGHRLADICASVASVVGVPLEMVVTPAGDEEPPATLADTQRCQALLGFTPATDLDGLIRRQAVADTALAGAL